MLLPLKLAASLPVVIVMLGGLLVSLLSKEGREVHVVYGFPNAFLTAFLVSIPALLLVVPNVAGAYAANNYGRAGVASYAAIFEGVLFLVMMAQFRAINSLFGPSGPFKFDDWSLYAILGVNVLIMLGVAAWFGRGNA